MMEGSRISPACLAILHTQGVLTSNLIALEFASLVFLASVVRHSEKKVRMIAVTNAGSHALVFFGRLYLRGLLL